MDVQQAYFTVKEFAKELKVHENTIRRAIKDGRIAAFRIGVGKRSSFRIAHSEIARITLLDLQQLIEQIIDKRGADGRSSSEEAN